MERMMKGKRSRRGVSLLAVSLLMTGIAVLSLALFTTVDSSGKAQRGARDQVNARYVTEAGLSVAMMNLSSGTPVADLNLGAEQAPVAFGSASYWVDAVDLGGNLYEVTATGVENNVGSQLKLVVREVTDNMFIWAAFGDEGMTMDSNAQVDSYNSTLGTYASQDVNGSGSKSYALSNGNIGSNQDIAVDSNVKVHGDATPGPGGTAQVTGNAIVSGSTVASTEVVEMPPIDLPVLPSMGDIDFDGGSTGPFHSFIRLGSYHFGDVEVKTDDLVVVGPATLVFDNFALLSNAEMWIDATNGPVEIFVVNDFEMNSNTLLAATDYSPANLSVNLLSDNVINPQVNVDLDTVDFDSNAQLYGTLYAPNASVTINSNFALYGSMMARRVHLDSNARVHFDEALLSSSSNTEKTFETVAWRHIPYHP